MRENSVQSCIMVIIYTCIGTKINGEPCVPLLYGKVHDHDYKHMHSVNELVKERLDCLHYCLHTIRKRQTLENIVMTGKDQWKRQR